MQLRGTTPTDHYQRKSIRSPRGRNEVIAPEILPSRKTRYSRDDRWKSNAGIARVRERERNQTPRPRRRLYEKHIEWHSGRLASSHKSVETRATDVSLAHVVPIIATKSANRCVPSPEAILQKRKVCEEKTEEKKEEERRGGGRKRNSLSSYWFARPHPPCNHR